MAERDTPAGEIAGHYKVKCPVFPEELKHRRTNNLLLYLAQRGPMKASENLGNSKHVAVEAFLLIKHNIW